MRSPHPTFISSACTPSSPAPTPSGPALKPRGRAGPRAPVRYGWPQNPAEFVMPRCRGALRLTCCRPPPTRVHHANLGGSPERLGRGGRRPPAGDHVADVEVCLLRTLITSSSLWATNRRTAERDERPASITSPTPLSQRRAHAHNPHVRLANALRHGRQGEAERTHVAQHARLQPPGRVPLWPAPLQGW